MTTVENLRHIAKDRARGAPDSGETVWHNCELLSLLADIDRCIQGAISEAFENGRRYQRNVQAEKEQVAQTTQGLKAAALNEQDADHERRIARLEERARYLGEQEKLTQEVLNEHEKKLGNVFKARR